MNKGGLRREANRQSEKQEQGGKDGGREKAFCLVKSTFSRKSLGPAERDQLLFSFKNRHTAWMQ